MNEQSSLFQSLPESRSVPSQAPTPAAAPRVLMAQRNQIALRPMDVEATVGSEHAVRNVWAFVERLDLSGLYAEIGSGEGGGGGAGAGPQDSDGAVVVRDGGWSGQRAGDRTADRGARRLSLDLRRGEREPSYVVGF